MMGIGFGEMILIAGIALVVIGPEKFPDFAKIALRTIRDFRGYMDDIKQEVGKELRPVQKELQALSRYDPETYLNKLTADEKKPASSSKSSTSYDKTGTAAADVTAQTSFREPQPGEEHREDAEIDPPVSQPDQADAAGDSTEKNGDGVDIPERLDG
jgi:sec-independent protein translocase protein TatB